MKKLERDILIARNGEKAENLLNKMRGKSPIFVCVGGSTGTAKIPGLSIAGKEPELTDYTPAADLEIIIHGKPKCMDEIPVTPQGLPTPALLTLSTLELADIPPLLLDSGMKMEPQAPMIKVGGKPGKDIRKKNAVSEPQKSFHNAELAGKALGRTVEYLVIGETIPGGTTTAFGTLAAMGIDAEGKISSSMPENPHELKIKVVEEGMKASGIEVGDLEKDPMKAVSLMGDPMMPAFAGLAAGAAEYVPIILAGGTQMGAILMILNVAKPKILGNIIVGTTKWIIQDGSSDLKGIINQISDVPILAANLDFSRSKFAGLRVYEEGFVKEGVGAGGAAIAAMLKSDPVDASALMEETEKNYEILVKK